jgi:hypothetical protein
MKSVDYMTPFEAWHRKKLAVHHLKMFGCIVYVQNTMLHLKNLEDRGCKMNLVGYESGSKAYHAYNPVMKSIHVTCDVVFDEQAQWDWSTGSDNGEPGGGDDVFRWSIPPSVMRLWRQKEQLRNQESSQHSLLQTMTRRLTMTSMTISSTPTMTTWGWTMMLTMTTSMLTMMSCFASVASTTSSGWLGLCHVHWWPRSCTW